MKELVRFILFAITVALAFVLLKDVAQATHPCRAGESEKDCSHFYDYNRQRIIPPPNQLDTKQRGFDETLYGQQEINCLPPIEAASAAPFFDREHGVTIQFLARECPNQKTRSACLDLFYPGPYENIRCQWQSDFQSSQKDQELENQEEGNKDKQGLEQAEEQTIQIPSNLLKRIVEILLDIFSILSFR